MLTNFKVYVSRLTSIMMLLFSITLFSYCSADEIEDSTPDEDNKEENINENNSNLKFVKNGDSYGIKITDDNGNIYATQSNPAIICVRDNEGKERTIMSGYHEVTTTTNGFKCIATVTSTNGSQFTITDNISAINKTSFRIKRSVKVDKANTSDKGFYSQFSIISSASGSSFSSFNLFAPGFLYRNNKNNNPYENNPDYKSGSFTFRETRYGLPMFMAHSNSDKKTISLSHINPKIKSGIDEQISKSWTASSSRLRICS